MRQCIADRPEALLETGYGRYPTQQLRRITLTLTLTKYENGLAKSRIMRLRSTWAWEPEGENQRYPKE